MSKKEEQIQHRTAFVYEQEANEETSEQAESQYPIQRNIPTALSRWLRRGAALALFLACLGTGGNVLSHLSYAASYQPAQCLIQYTQVGYVQPSGSGHSSPYYEPESKISVIYNPQNPHHHFRIAKSLRGEEITCWCFLILFWIPATIFLLALLWAA